MHLPLNVHIAIPITNSYMLHTYTHMTYTLPHTTYSSAAVKFLSGYSVRSTHVDTDLLACSIHVSIHSSPPRCSRAMSPPSCPRPDATRHRGGCYGTPRVCGGLSKGGHRAPRCRIRGGRRDPPSTAGSGGSSPGGGPGEGNGGEEPRRGRGGGRGGGEGAVRVRRGVRGQEAGAGVCAGSTCVRMYVCACAHPVRVPRVPTHTPGYPPPPARIPPPAAGGEGPGPGALQWRGCAFRATPRPKVSSSRWGLGSGVYLRKGS